MKNEKVLSSTAQKQSKRTYSRRKFINTLGSTTAGLIAAPYLLSKNVFGYGYQNNASYVSQVALTQADRYSRAYVKNKVAHLFESLGGLSGVVKRGDKVALKLNLVGGSGNAYNEAHQGRSVTETMWTHPEVFRAVGELLIDEGVNPGDIYAVEALWDDESYNDFGYREAQNELGMQFVDLNKPDPYDDYMELQVGDHKSYYNSFTCNRILDEIDVYVSIAKMKQHFSAGVTHSIKNQVGIVPLQPYATPQNPGRRDALHVEGGEEGTHLPNAISDLFFACPIHLSVIDGIMNSVGGEGSWNPTFEPADYNVLLAGKDPVATDSVASYVMGNNPELDIFDLPGGGHADNHLKKLNDFGAGTNKMSEIRLVGDGAGIITSAPPENLSHQPHSIVLGDNFPNPFNPSTSITFYIPDRQAVQLRVYTVTGQLVDTLVNGVVPAGHHEIRWNASGVASGVYLYTLTANNFRVSKKMLYQK
ncbi:DUF362 domain-containing protein [Balneolales bacterium ANBcel1]|nr:DUF362 domain-containing protein [Balneolales bacterium ANBcel1]